MESRAGSERITKENMLNARNNAGSGQGCATGKRRRCKSEIAAINRSSRLAMVEIQQAAEPLAFFDLAGLVRSFSAGKEDDVVDPLVRSFDAENSCEKLRIEFHGLTTRTNRHSWKSGKQKGHPGTTWEHSTVPSGRESC